MAGPQGPAIFFFGAKNPGSSGDAGSIRETGAPASERQTERGLPMTRLHPQPRALVHSGLIVAEMSLSPDGVTFHGPLSFDGETVAETGSWFHPLDPTDGNAISDALCDTYIALHDDWVDRKAFDIAPKPKRRHLAVDPRQALCPAF